MIKNERIKIGLVQINNSFSDQCYLPLSVGMLQAYAKKHLIYVSIIKGSIPADIYIKRGAAKILLKPAPEGTGVIAGGAVRAVVEAAGIRNISSKILGTKNKASNVYATLEALKELSK